MPVFIIQPVQLKLFFFFFLNRNLPELLIDLIVAILKCCNGTLDLNEELRKIKLSTNI